MGADLSQVSILTRREIEALIAVPLIKAFIKEFGEEKTLEITKKVIESLAQESGRMLAEFVGGNSLEDLAKGLALWSQDGANESELVEITETKIATNITRCRYADMYKEHGMEKFGYLLSCGRDFAMVAGFNPQIQLTRTKTIMEGDDICDFLFEMEEKD